MTAVARIIRPLEERVAELDRKIEKKKAELAALEAKKQKLLHPNSMRSVMNAAKEAGMTPDEIAEKLGLDL